LSQGDRGIMDISFPHPCFFEEILFFPSMLSF
jgi:hypothetical protein